MRQTVINLFPDKRLSLKKRSNYQQHSGSYLMRTAGIHLYSLRGTSLRKADVMVAESALGETPAQGGKSARRASWRSEMSEQRTVFVLSACPSKYEICR